ncbi:peptidylprolyl isomerase [uncultured Flavonifractor sp.]|uniref:peptidylprolyl isomerase n=1 Tax=uncultured Flavonifractor sp. TaxID=1193534 RepID=UPI00261F0D7D|nr:peptidylprolyl isomerase [uncultured Flavonifractor sp.]
MSASREKKQRQGDLAQGLTQKQRQELKEQQAAKRKAVLYTGIGIVIAVLVVILLVWHSGIFQRRATALSVGGRDYNVNDVNYYFYTALTEEYYYANMFGGAAFDPTADLHTQYVDEEETQSYYDYFLEQAVERLTEAAALENAAAEEGYTLTEEDKASVEENLASYESYAQQSYPNLESFLKANFGRYMTTSAFRTCLERATLVDSYKNAYLDKQEVTGEELDAYYEENADALDSYDYRYILVDGSVPETTDEEGNTVEPTEEETAAAMQAAEVKANQFADAVRAAEDREAAFIELAPDYVSESSRDSYAEDPDRSLTTGTLGSSLVYYDYGSWLQEAGRAAGDVTVIEGTDSYYVVLFLDRYRVEEPTVDIRHILIKAETAEADDETTEDVDESTTPTQEALDAAKAEAEDLLAQWEAGDKTAESFGALAKEYSDDSGSKTAGGLYEHVTKGQMFDAFDAWIFDQARQSGDTTLVENPQSGQQGWHVIYFQDWAAPVWENTADSAIRTQRQTDWLTELTEGLEAVQGSGIKYVG